MINVATDIIFAYKIISLAKFIITGTPVVEGAFATQKMNQNHTVVIRVSLNSLLRLIWVNTSCRSIYSLSPNPEF